MLALGCGVDRFLPWTRTHIRLTTGRQAAEAGLADLAELTAVLDRPGHPDLDRLPDTVRAERVLKLRQLVDRLDGQWLKELAGVDARGAAGAEHGPGVGSTAAWLRNRLHLSDRAASSAMSGPPEPCSGAR